MVTIKCAHCGKEFIKNNQSIYTLKKGNKVLRYCSYPCWVANDSRRYNFQKGRYSKRQ